MAKKKEARAMQFPVTYPTYLPSRLLTIEDMRVSVIRHQTMPLKSRHWSRDFIC